jgi:hypothetical protein
MKQLLFLMQKERTPSIIAFVEGGEIKEILLKDKR